QNSFSNGLEASPILWVDSETATSLLNKNLNKNNNVEEEGVVDAEVVDNNDNVKNEKQQPFSEMATDLAATSTVWLQKTFAHLHMPTITPNIKIPNLQIPNLHNFSSPKFSTMNFG